MSTTRPAARPQPGPAPTRRSSTPWIVGIVVAVIAVLGLAVVLLSGGDDEDEDVDAAPIATTAVAPGEPSADIAQYRPIEVAGEPLAPLEDPADDPAVGTTVPTVTGASFDGTPITIGPRAEGPTMVVVLAHWCPHCNAEVPRLIQLQQEGRLPADLRIVGVSTAVAADRPNYPPSQWVVDKGWPWEVVADSEEQAGAAAYGVTGFPFVTVFDEDGTVTARWSGESDVDELADQIAAAVGA